ncbi:inositol oxygenase isoform X3 [Chelonia mydas]|uniref:inositol oxygenase isoform X3 n=1 Tax=Chelonia mydas TaxID=8469 RepID=UPI001CA80DE2|nr:inositol oxygenase isoform X3 [Chelonia mydas]
MKVIRLDADPSEVYRPEAGAEHGKLKTDYRNYTAGPLLDRVYNTYLLMHTHQTVDFVRKKSAEYGACAQRRMSIMEALDLLDNMVDESDPDVDFPNSYHAYQTAEGIRQAHPDKVGRGGRHVPRGLQGPGVRRLQRLHLPRQPRHKKPPVQLAVRDLPASQRPGQRAYVLGPRRVHVQSHEIQQLCSPPGGFLHDPLPLLLPLAHGRGLHAPVQQRGPAHAGLGQGIQQV